MTPSQTAPPPDTLTQRIGVLTRREVEARILAPIIEALGAAFGREDVVAVLAQTIVQVARHQGEELDKAMAGNDCGRFMASLQHWSRDGALELTIHKQDDRHLHFDVTRCRYAEMYRSLGIPELGGILSCGRDFALIEGFNPQASLKRTRTIMNGAPVCDFRYTFAP